MEPSLSDEEQKVWDILNAPFKTQEEEMDGLMAALKAWNADPVRVKKFMDGFKQRMDRVYGRNN